MRKLSKKIDDIKLIDICVIFAIMLLICIVNVTNKDLVINPDLRFLYNRALQMYNCLSDGNFPFFYYNDFGGAGYGSSFFYGDLTLYPFLPTVKFGIEKFLLAYTSVTIILTYLGVASFAKRFSKNYKFTALIYMCCCYTLQSFYTFGTYANLLAVALSFFFLAKCVDFFRDNKSFFPASVLFFLIINTHSITAMFSFILCCCIMLMYFDSSKLCEYAKFAGLTCLMCSYFVINALYHSDILTHLDSINSTMLEYAERGDVTVIGNYLSYLPFAGTLETIIAGTFGVDLGLSGCKLFNTIVFVFLVVFFIKRLKTFSVKESYVLAVVVLSLIIGERHIWVFLNKIYTLSFQFPTRYVPYAISLLLIILLKDADKRWIKAVMFISCLVDCFLIGFMTVGITNVDQYSELFCQVENGEYLDESFIWETDTFYYYSSHVTDQEGREYDYSVDSDGGITVNLSGVDCSQIKSLTIPKLYYNGYKCYSGEKQLPLKLGYSQFIEVDMSDFDGDSIYVAYRHPQSLVMLYILCNCIALYSIACIFFNKILLKGSR